MSGWKSWAIGEVVEADDFQNFVQDQVVQVYSNAAARGSALGTAVADGMVAYMQDGSQLATYGTASGWSGVPLSPNYIINGAFDIWQRGTSFSFAENAGTYAADRFIGIATSSTPATLTVSRQAFTPGSAPVAGYEASFFYRQALSAAVTSGVNVTRQRVEDVRTLAGQTVTISYWAKADSSITGYAAPFIRQNFGSGGSASVDTTFTSHTYTTSWARYTSTVTLPNLTGKTIGTNSFLEVVITLATNAASTFDLWGVQLEAGSVATPFKRNANSIQGELAACQRYYYRQTPTVGGRTFGVGMVNAATQALVFVDFPVTMRTIPTTFEQSGTASDYRVFSGTDVATNLSSVPTLSNATTKAAVLSFQVASGLTTGHSVFGQRSSTASGENAFIGFGAEL